MITKMESKALAVARAKQLIAGAEKHLTNVPQVTLMGSSYTPAQLTTQFQALVTLRADVDAARATTTAKLALETANAPLLRALTSAFVAYVKVTYGSSPDVLADFGVHPKARTTSTVEAKALAAAKREATRAARHTMGPRMKKEIKGDVTGIVLTPVVTPRPTAPAPSSPAVPASEAGSPEKSPTA